MSHKPGHDLVQADKSALTHELGIQLRDLRLLDPQLAHSYPSAILCREKALVVNLEHIKCIITTDQVSPITWDSMTQQLCRALRSWLPMGFWSASHEACPIQLPLTFDQGGKALSLPWHRLGPAPSWVKLSAGRPCGPLQSWKPPCPQQHAATPHTCPASPASRVADVT